MNPYTRPPPFTASSANSEQTNPTRTNNPRDRDNSPANPNTGSSEDLTNARQDPASDNPAAQMQRLNQVIQNFHTKAALIILHSRVELQPAYSRNSDTKRINRWFNIELEETDDYKEEIKRWKLCDLKDDRPPPLIIEVFLMTEQLQQGQRLVILDEDGKRWELTNSITSLQSRGTSRTKTSETGEILLERWKIQLGDATAPISSDLNAMLPLVYKKSIVLFRSLFTYCNFLPAWKLSRKLGKGRSYLAMKLGYRIIDGSRLSRLSRTDNLKTALYDSTSDVVGDYSFGVTESPAGPFSVSVTYRQNCDFRIDDSEELLSSRFWGTDEDLFRPSLSEDKQKDRSAEPGSLPTDTRQNLLKRPELGHAYGGLSTFHEAGIGPSTSPISALRNAQDFSTVSPPHADFTRPLPTDSTSGSTSRTSLLAAAAARRSSFSFQAFKAPPLSASPLGSSPLATSPRSHSGRVPVLGSLTEESGLPTQLGTASLRKPSSLISDAGIPVASTSSSPKPGKYSSSFTHRRGRLSSGGTATRADEDQTSSGRASATSSAQPGSGLMAEANTAGTSSGSMQEDDDNISDFLKMLDIKKDHLAPPSGSAAEAATRKTAAALNKFHRMRDSNAALSDSMSSSLMMHRSSSSSSRQLSSVPPMVGPTSFSTSSSPGKPISPHTPHTPFAPSRLSAAYSNDESHEESSHIPELVEPTSPSEIGTSSTAQGQSMAQIGAIPIPNSPRTFLPAYRRASSAQRGPMSSDEDIDNYGPRSASMGAHDNRDSQRENTTSRITESRNPFSMIPTERSSGQSSRTPRQDSEPVSPPESTSRQPASRFSGRSPRAGFGGRPPNPSATASNQSFGSTTRSPEPSGGSIGTTGGQPWNRSRPGSGGDRPESKFDEDDLPFALDKSDFTALDKSNKGQRSA